MDAHLLPVHALGPAEIQAWRDLAARAVDPNPMNEPGFVLAAANHLPHRREIQLLVAEEGGRFHGVVPIRRIRRTGRLVLPVATTDVRRMTYLGTPLLDERGREASRHLLAALARERWRQRWAFAAFKWIGEGQATSMLRGAIADLGLPVTLWEDFDQPFLTRRPNGVYTDHQSKRHISDYRRRARRLADALGTELVVVDRAGDPSAADEYTEMEAAGYKRGTGVAMATKPGEPAYFAEMCRRFADEGRLHILCLQAGDRTVSMEVLVRSGDGLFMVKVGYDESLGRYDPGVQLHLEGMRYLHEHTDAQWIDVCTFGGNDLLLRLYPDRRRTLTLLVGLGGGAERALLHSLPAARRAWKSALRHRDAARELRDRRRPAAPGMAVEPDHAPERASAGR